jgi:hypothetical protein
MGADEFETASVRKAVALYYYTLKAKQLLRARRDSSALQREISQFKAYFEGAAAACDDPSLLSEVALWDQLVEVKRDNLARQKRNRGACAIL